MTKYFSFTRFDLTVFTVIVVLSVVIAATVVFGIREAVPRVAYLRISENGFYEVWIAEAESPDSAERLTFTQNGVSDFDVSSRYVVFSERDFESGISDLKLLDLTTDNVRQLTNCVMQDADCTAPRFRPDGNVIAYERLDRNTGLGTGIGSNRIWLLDLTSNPATTYPLFEDRQILGYGAEWSADGSRLAFYDSVNAGILVYDFDADQAAGDSVLNFVSSTFGTVGSLSPDGNQIVYPEILIDSALTRGYLQIADLESGFIETLSDPNEQADDQQAVWSPTGDYIAMTRLYRDERFTRGAQIYLVNMADKSIDPLIFDERYGNGLPSWSVDGQYLAVQRFQQLDDNSEVTTNASTEVWTYNLETRKLTRIDTNAIRPRWIP